MPVTNATSATELYLAVRTASMLHYASLARRISISIPPQLSAKPVLILLAVCCARMSQFASCAKKSISCLVPNANSAVTSSKDVSAVSVLTYVSSVKQALF